MDLLDFDAEPLYFDAPIAAEVTELLEQASACYPEPSAEVHLLKASGLAPDHLMVLVALYRFYFYQNRLDDAEQCADRAMAASAREIGFPTDWRDLELTHVGSGSERSMALTRFWLLALKAAAVLALRQEKIELGLAMLDKITEVDEMDRIGARGLAEMVRRRETEGVPHLYLVETA